MNIALSAVILFILLMPPVAFYLAFIFGAYPKASPKFSILEGILAMALIALAIHSIGIFFVDFFYKEIHFDILVKLLGGELKDIESKVKNHDFDRYIKQFTTYNFVLLVIFGSLGRLCRMIVHKYGIHFRSPLFRLYNRWWYLFNSQPNDLIFMDVSVDTNEGTTFFSGFLLDFKCKGEELEQIYLNSTIRREFKKIQTSDKNANTVTLVQIGDATPIEGDTFVIPYSKANNFNIRYIVLEDQEPE